MADEAEDCWNSLKKRVRGPEGKGYLEGEFFCPLLSTKKLDQNKAGK
jgi:hypothetical protein